MNFVSRRAPERKPISIVMSLMLFAVVGCDGNDVKVYRIAKEQPSAPHAQSPHGEPQGVLPGGHPDISATAKPQLSWTLPEGWKEAPPSSRMNVDTFSIAGKDGKEAQVAITPLRGMAGKEVPIVNMWRQQVGLSEISTEAAQKELHPVQVGGESGKMFEVTGKAGGDSRKTRIVTAMVHRGDTSWFYKLSGDADVVEAQKPAFVSFLKSIKMTEVPATQITSAPVPQAEAPAVSGQWKIPAGWKTVAPGPMQAAKFSVPPKGAGKADVMVSVFPTDTGGTLGNVNRWRRQMGLPDVTEAEAGKLVTKLDDKNPDAILVDMSNNERRLVGAIIPRDGQWYFFKLLGDAAAVAPQKDAFIVFVKSPQ